MNFIKEKIKDFYLLDSKVENIFINEYMPGAPGDFVKVFIYAQMYAEFGLEMTNEMMAKQLGISEKKIQEAWVYWEKMGAIKRHYQDETGKVDFTVEFLNLKELMYGKSLDIAKGEEDDGPASKDVFGNENIRAMFDEIEKTMARSLSSTEISNILSWVTDYGIAPEVVLYGVSYCMDRKKSSLRYIEKVVKNWQDEGYKTVDEVREYLQQVDERYYRYRRILNALGFKRNASEAEIKMMDSWFDEMGYNMDRILEACGKTAGISNPNFRYVNSVLVNWKKEAENRGDSVNKKVIVTQAVLNQYYDYLRNKAEKEAEERKAEIYKKLPRIEEIDNEIGRLSSELSKALLLGSDSSEMKRTMDSLTEERAIELTEHNFEMDYTDIKYACEKCNDTGITDLGERCSCIRERMEEAELWQKKREN